MSDLVNPDQIEQIVGAPPASADPAEYGPVSDAEGLTGQDATGETPDAAEALDGLDASDPEHAHAQADEILLTAVPQEVRDAYNRLAERCRWWAFA